MLFGPDALRPFLEGTGADKTLRVWPDGDHTIYNHCQERTSFVADWFADKLARRWHLSRASRIRAARVASAAPASAVHFCMRDDNFRARHVGVWECGSHTKRPPSCKEEDNRALTAAPYAKGVPRSTLATEPTFTKHAAQSAGARQQCQATKRTRRLTRESLWATGPLKFRPARPHDGS